MKILVGHEASQTVMIELRKRGHDAFSCDILPCYGGFPAYHLQMDVMDAIKLKKWDAALFFPDCTYLTISAAWAYKDPPYHMKLKPGTLTGMARIEARAKAIKHVIDLWNCGIEAISIENPIGVLSAVWMKPTQIIQPYHFGEDASKKTCLWLKGLPPLQPTKYITPRRVNGKPRWGNQTDGGQNKLPPSSDRAKIRGTTYQGIAIAMATQWF